MQAYIQTAINNLKSGSQVQIFTDLILPLDLAYTAIITNPPKKTQLLIRFLLICHKSLLSAAASIVQGQPEDSGAITRRALECARVALAVTLNPDNALKWVSFEDRDQRWKQRRKGERPKNLNLQYPELKNEPLTSKIDDQLGILSDAVVHFTPEFYHHLDWKEKPGPNGDNVLLLNYFNSDEREIERNLLGLAAAHGTILKVFDRCFDNGISSNPDLLNVVNNFWASAKLFNQIYTEKYKSDESRKNS